MLTTSAPAHASGTEPPLAWRPVQRSTRVAILGALLATVFYQLFLLDPRYRGPVWLWAAMILAEGLTAFHAIGTWWTILAHDDRPEPAEVTVWRQRLAAVRDRLTTRGPATRRLSARAAGPAPTRATQTALKQTATSVPVPPAQDEVPSIDVFVTAFGEPMTVVRTTLRAAVTMELPHRTYLLDDGGSDELARLCAEEGVTYLRRDSRADAKAGNVNAALARTAGEFVVIFDADHVPRPNFLLQVLPYFHDPEVAFVQSPQHYTNKVNLVATGAAEAQRIFYELVCPGKNHFNAAFCVGTNVMFRRSALADVGGIATGTNSEDIWTSVRLHQRGWKSTYVPVVLAQGLAPQHVGTYLKQQLRWAGGGFEVLFRGGLFRRRTGLTIDQRLQYLFTGTHYLLSIAMLTFMVLPAMYLLFGQSPIKSDGWTWASHYVPFYAMILLVTWLQSGGFRVSAIVASIGATPVHARALWATLSRRPAVWRATNGENDNSRSLWAVMPHVALLILNVTAIVVGLIVMADPAPTWLSVGWASLLTLILGRMIVESLRRGHPVAQPATALVHRGGVPAPRTAERVPARAAS